MRFRTRNRVPRPKVITPSPVEEDDEESSFTLSRGAALGGPGRHKVDDDDDEEEQVRRDTHLLSVIWTLRFQTKVC
jgi:hypothetical protein